MIIERFSLLGSDDLEQAGDLIVVGFSIGVFPKVMGNFSSLWTWRHDIEARYWPRQKKTKDLNGLERVLKVVF